MVGRKLDSREAAADWIDRNQLGRRNLHPDAFTLLLGRRYNRQKKQGFKGNQHTNRGGGQNVHKLKTAEALAKEHSVDERTVRRAGKFASAIEKVKAITPDIESGVNSSAITVFKMLFNNGIMGLFGQPFPRPG